MGSVVVVSVVSSLIGQLELRGVYAELFNNAGGVMVVRHAGPGYEILITERDDSFEIYGDDNDMAGLLATFAVIDDEGDASEFISRYGPVTLYRSSSNLMSVNDVADVDGVLWPPLSAVSMSVEVRDCADVVAWVVEKVTRAHGFGRSGVEGW